MANDSSFDEQIDDDDALLQNLMQNAHIQSTASTFRYKGTGVGVGSGATTSSSAFSSPRGRPPSHQPPSPPSSSHSRYSLASAASNAFRDGHFELLGKAGDSDIHKTYGNKDINDGFQTSSPLEYALHEQNNHQTSYRRMQDDPNDIERGIQQQQQKQQQKQQQHPPPSKEEIDLNIMLRMFGEPYSNRIYFWIQILPSVILLGLLIGTGSFFFLISFKTILFTWAYDNHAFGSYMAQEEPNQDDGIVLLTRGHWWWLWVTTLGECLAGAVLLFPKAPKLGGAKNFFHDAVTLQGDVEQTPYVIISSFISLCSGASMGPEMVLGAFGTGLATFLGQRPPTPSPNQPPLPIHRRIASIFTKCVLFPLSIFHSRPRIQMVLVLCGMAAALGSILPSPVLAVLLVLELSIAARPGDLRLDAAVALAVAHHKDAHFGVLDEEDEERLESYSPSAAAQRHAPMESRVAGDGDDGAAAAAAAEMDGGNAKNHDYMEQMTLIGMSSTVAFMAFQGLAYIAVQWKQHDMLSIQQTTLSVHSKPFPHFGTTNIKHIAMAIPLGILCGFLGGIFIALNGIFRKIRERIFIGFNRMGLPHFVTGLFIPTLCGLLQGIIAVFYPLTLGSGVLILSDVIDMGMNLDNDTTTQSNAAFTPQIFLISGLMKILSSGLCLGFGGLIGGQMFALVFAGACIGIAIPHYVPIFPAYITIPCCMASITGSFVPVPLTISAFAMMRMGNSLEMSAAVLVSVTMAYTCFSGLGLIQKGKKKLGLGGREQKNRQQALLDLNQYLEMDYDVNEIIMDGNSKDLVRNVTSIIFK